MLRQILQSFFAVAHSAENPVRHVDTLRTVLGIPEHGNRVATIGKGCGYPVKRKVEAKQVDEAGRPPWPRATSGGMRSRR